MFWRNVDGARASARRTSVRICWRVCGSRTGSPRLGVAIAFGLGGGGTAAGGASVQATTRRRARRRCAAW
jgi:hypothetical protein